MSAPLPIATPAAAVNTFAVKFLQALPLFFDLIFLRCRPSHHSAAILNISFQLAPTPFIPRYITVTQFNEGQRQCAPSNQFGLSYSLEAPLLSGQPMTREWIAVGHSESGSAMWALNERGVYRPTGGYLGSVATAPALQSLELERYRLENDLPFELAYPSYKLSAMAQLYSSINTCLLYRIGSQTSRFD